MKRRWIAFLLALTMMLGLAGCSAADEPPAESVQPPAADESETRVFVDDVGREVEIPAEPAEVIEEAEVTETVEPAEAE